MLADFKARLLCNVSLNSLAIAVFLRAKLWPGRVFRLAFRQSIIVWNLFVRLF
jgi:hypothetical protein